MEVGRYQHPYPVVERIRDEILQRGADVVSLNEVCERQYEHLLVLLRDADWEMQGHFGKTADAPLARCREGADPRNDAGNAVLVRGTVTERQTYRFGYPKDATSVQRQLIAQWPDGNYPPNMWITDRGVACLTAVIIFPDQPTRVCSAHLSTESSDHTPTTLIPDLEVAELVRVFGPEAQARPFILMGDFNLTPDKPSMAALYASPAGTGEFVESISNSQVK